MPLINRDTEAAFKSNLKGELAANKPRNQALAIAYRIQRHAAKKADGGAVSSDQDDLQSALTGVSSSYPTLAPYMKDAVVQRGVSSGPNDDRQLEFYQPWESENPNPGKLTTEIYNNNLKGPDLQQAIAGDALHHLGAIDPRTSQPVDPQWLAMKQRLIDARQPDHEQMDRGAYQQEQSSPYGAPSYDDWMKNNRADAYIRAGLFPDQNPEWQKPGLLTPEMGKIFEEMKNYLTKPQQKASGGRISPAMSIAQRVQRDAKKKSYAAGGAPTSPPFYVRSEAHGLEHAGMIHSPIAGRTDRIPMGVGSKSYVIPADIVSSIGQGNSMAGANGLNKLLKMGPYGSMGGAAPRSMAPKMVPMPRPQKMFADGGDVDPSPMPGATPPVDIVAAGGEFVVPPEKVAEIGGGDVSHGHNILDAMVKHVRKKTIKTLRKLPGPKKN